MGRTLMIQESTNRETGALTATESKNRERKSTSWPCMVVQMRHRARQSPFSDSLTLTNLDDKMTSMCG